MTSEDIDAIESLANETWPILRSDCNAGIAMDVGAVVNQTRYLPIEDWFSHWFFYRGPVATPGRTAAGSSGLQGQIGRQLRDTDQPVVQLLRSTGRQRYSIKASVDVVRFRRIRGKWTRMSCIERSYEAR